MFYKKVSTGYTEKIPGLNLKTLVHGEKTSFTEMILQKGTVVPMHNHIHEQTGYLVKGRLQFNIDGEEIIAEEGDCWNIASNVMHSAEALEETILIEVFSPVREDYL